MARRRRIYAKYGKAEIGFEWVGFRGAGTVANLDTNTAFELVAPAGASAIGVQMFTVKRVVGTIFVKNQSGVTSSAKCGIILLSSSVGGDQTVNELVDPLSTDPDDFANKDIMWWWSGRPTYPGPAADMDQAGFEIPIDVRVQRRMSKRHRLFFNATAATTGTVAMDVNVRVLLKHS